MSAKQKAQEWATIEDREDVVEAMKSDDAEDLTQALPGIHMEEEESLDGEEDGSTSMGGGGSEPPPYADLSQHFGTLENYASGCGLTGASYFVKKARMVRIEAHASKPARQANFRDFLKRGRYGFGSGSLTVALQRSELMSRERGATPPCVHLDQQ